MILSPERDLGVADDLAKDERRDVLGAERLAFVLKDEVGVAHVLLDPRDDPVGLDLGRLLGGVADDDVVAVEEDHRRRDPLALLVGDDDRLAVLVDIRDRRVSGSQVDPVHALEAFTVRHWMGSRCSFMRQASRYSTNRDRGAHHDCQRHSHALRDVRRAPLIIAGAWRQPSAVRSMITQPEQLCRGGHHESEAEFRWGEERGEPCSRVSDPRTMKTRSMFSRDRLETGPMKRMRLLWMIASMLVAWFLGAWIDEVRADEPDPVPGRLAPFFHPPEGLANDLAHIAPPCSSATELPFEPLTTGATPAQDLADLARDPWALGPR